MTSAYFDASFCPPPRPDAALGDFHATYCEPVAASWIATDCAAMLSLLFEARRVFGEAGAQLLDFGRGAHRPPSKDEQSAAVAALARMLNRRAGDLPAPRGSRSLRPLMGWDRLAAALDADPAQREAPELEPQALARLRAALALLERFLDASEAPDAYEARDEFLDGAPEAPTYAAPALLALLAQRHACGAGVAALRLAADPQQPSSAMLEALGEVAQSTLRAQALLARSIAAASEAQRDGWRSIACAPRAKVSRARRASGDPRTRLIFAAAHEVLESAARPKTQTSALSAVADVLARRYRLQIEPRDIRAKLLDGDAAGWPPSHQAEWRQIRDRFWERWPGRSSKKSKPLQG